MASINKEKTENETTEDEESPETMSVPLSEEFQARTLDHLKGASKDELNFVHDQTNKHLDEIHKKESHQDVTIDDYPKSSDY